MAKKSNEELRRRYSRVASDREESQAMSKDTGSITTSDRLRARYAGLEQSNLYNSANRTPNIYDSRNLRFQNAYGLNRRRTQREQLANQTRFMDEQRRAVTNGIDNGNNTLGLKNLENPLDNMRRLEAYKEAYGKNNKLSYDESQKLEKAYGKYNRQQLEQLKEHFKNAPERDYSGEIAWVNEKLLKTATGKENKQRQNILESQIKDADNRLERLQEAYADRLVGGGTDNGDYLDKLNQIKQEKSQLQNELNDYKELTNYSDQDDFGKYKLLGEANPNNPVRFFRTHSDEQANAIFDPTIRNEVDTAHHESTYTGGGSNQSDRALYRAITDEEADNYSYILGKYGQEEADKYLQAVAKHTDVNGSLTALQEAQEQGYKNPLLRTAESIGLGLITPVEAAKNLISGDEVRTYDDYKLAGRQEALRSGAAEKLTGGNEIGTFLYNTATSAADNLLRYAVGGGIGAVTGDAGAAEGAMRLMMGGQVMDSAMKNALDRGLSDSQAVTTALISAVNEELFETISLSNLKAMQSVTPKNYRELAKNIGKQFLGEGSEEMFTDIGNAIADDLVNGEKSEIRQNILNYMKQGMSEEEAKKQASVDFALQLVESGLSGGITGAAMGGAVAVDQAKSIKANQKYKELFNTYKESGLSEEDAVNTALSEVMNGLQTVRDKEGNVKDYKGLNKSIDKAIASAKNINENVKNIEAEMNGVAPVIEEDIRDNEENIRDNEVNNEYLTDMQRVLSHGDITTDAQAQQFLSDQDEMVAKYPDKKDEIIKATVDVYMKGKNNAEVFDRIASKVTNTMAKNETSLESKNTTSEGISQKEDKPAKVDFKANVNGEETVITSVNKDNMTVRDSVGNETTIPINAAEMTDGASAAVEQAKQYGKRGSRLYLENMAGNIRNYTYTFNDFYNAGKQGKEFYGRNTRGLDTNFLREVYDAGVQDGSKASKTGGLVRNDARYTIQESEARVLDAVGKAFNVTIQMDHMLSHDANGYLSDGIIHISTSAEKPSLVVFSHEFTHRLEDTSPEAYKAYKDYVINYLKKTSDEEGNNVYETREIDLKNAYASQGVDLSDKELQDELVANATESFLSDTDFIEDLVKENKSLAQQILDVLKQMLEDLKNVFAEKYDAKSKEGKALQDDLEAREEALKLWTNAIKNQDKSLIKKNNKTRYSMKELETNYDNLAKEYEEAVKEDDEELMGDLEADLSDIVEEYAKKKGFDTLVYHGTQDFGFTKIDTNMSDDDLSFFATNKLEVANTYSDAISEESYIRKVSDKSSYRGNYEFYANIDNMYKIDGKGANWNEINIEFEEDTRILNEINAFRELLKKAGLKEQNYFYDDSRSLLDDLKFIMLTDRNYDDDNKELTNSLLKKAKEIDEIKNNWNPEEHLDEYDDPIYLDDYINRLEDKSISYNTREIARIVKNRGYDGVIIKNIYDDGGQAFDAAPEGDVYIFFKPQEQLKSADAVTYDDKGNVIPLSERFNKSNDDIRFSLKEKSDKELEKLYDKAVNEDYDEELADKIVKQYAYNKGYTQKVYHGTQQFGFTKMDVSKSDDNLSVFTTSTNNMASSYSGTNRIRQVNETGSLSDEEKLKLLKDSGIWKDVRYFKANDEKQRLDYLKEQHKRMSSWAKQNVKELYDRNLMSDYKKFSNNLAEGILFHNIDVEQALRELEPLQNAHFVISDYANDMWYALQLLRGINVKKGWFYLDGRFETPGRIGEYNVANDNAGNYQLYANTDNLFEIDGHGRNWNDIKFITDETMKKIANFYYLMNDSGTYHDLVEYGGKLYDEFKSYLKDLELDNEKQILEAAKEIDYIYNNWNPNEHLDKNGNALSFSRFLDTYKNLENYTTREIAKYAYDNGYKGVVFKNIVDNGGRNTSEQTINAADVYAFFNPQEQLKSADPVTYDDDGNVIPLSERFNKSNDDIRFSLKEPVEETKDLIAVHNRNQEAVIEAVKLGGIAMPSTAITEAKTGHSGYGDVSIVFYKDTIDPSNPENKVFTSDAYTKRQPRIDYKLDNEKLKKLADEIGRYTSELESNVFNGTLADGVSYLGTDVGFIEKFAKEKGYEIKDKLRTPDVENIGLQKKFIQNYIKENNITIDKLLNDSSVKNDLENLFKENVANEKMLDFYNKKFISEIDSYKELMDLYEKEKEDVFKQAAEETKEKLARDIDVIFGKAKPYTDNYSHADGAKDLVDEHRKEFDDYAKNVIKSIYSTPGIYNGKEYYTNNGTRSFDELHYEYNLDNLVKAMKSSSVKNEETGWLQGIGQLRAATAKELKSIDEIKDKAKKYIKNELTEDIAKKYAEYEKEFSEVASKLQNESEYKVYDPFYDTAKRNIVEVISKYKTKKGIENNLRKYYKNLTKETLDDILNLVSKVAELPQKYFEAKPQRAVRLNEWAFLIIPNNASQELIDLLNENHIEYMTYEEGNEEDRKEKLNSRPDVRFSLKEDSEGNKLSPQQQEFFKDSKAVDDEGNLLVMYHGSRQKFTEFNLDAKGVINGRVLGDGFYFTNYKKRADYYGKRGKVFKVYLNIKNPLYFTETTKTPDKIKKILDESNERKYEEYKKDESWWGNKKNISKDKYIKDNKNNYSYLRDAIYELQFLYGSDENVASTDDVTRILKDLGYDGIIFDSKKKNEKEIVAFYPNQIKNVDNENPTDNPDIRFSLKEDSEGNKLSKEQQEYFKDSKVVDEDGNLLVMYHGTDAYKEFTIFKPGKSGYLGKGMYFSESKNYAERYAKQNGYEGRIYETYLNVKNPLIVTSENPAVEILGEKVAKKRELKNSFSTKWMTPADIKKLKAQGYDGIIWKYGTTPIEVSVWDSNQIKSVDNKKPTDNPDIRFSLKEESNINRNDVAALTGNNEYMAEAVNDLEETLNNRYGDLLFDVKNYELYDVFDEICKQYNIKGYSKQKFARNVKELFDYIKNVDHPDGVDTTMLAMQVAADMLDKGSVLDTTMLEMYPTLPEELRNKKIKISQQDRADLDGGYARFRRKYFGNLTLTDEGTEVDTVYEGLSAQYPELFPSDITHPADRLTQIGNVVDLFKRTLDHIQGASKEESAFIIAQDIINKAVLERTKHEDSIAKNKRLDIQAKVREQVANLKKAEKEIYYENIRLRRRIKTLESLNNNANNKIAKQEKEWEDYKSGKKQVKGQEKFYRKQYYEKLKEEFVLGEVTRSKAKNRAERQATIDMIKNLTNKLSRTVLRPSENNYVPTYLLNSMIDVLQMIDLDSGYRNPDGSPTKVYLHLQNLKKQYEALRTDAKYNASGEDEQIKQVAEVIDRIAETVKNKRVNQLTNYELENLLALMKIIHYQINRSQELFKNQNYKRVADLSEKARENIKKAGREFDPNAKVKNIANKYLNNTLSPVRLFKRLEGYAKDGALTTIAEELQNGERESKLIKQTANDILKDLYETKEARKLLEEFRTKKLVYKFGEKEVVITPEMRVALYLHSLNEDNYRHIVGREKEDTQGNISYEGGGVVIPNYHKQKKSTNDTLKIHQAEKYTGQDVIKLTPQNVETIIKDMDEYDRMIVSKYKELNSYITDKLNDTTEELYGYKKATVKNYFPIIVDKSMLELDSDVLKLDKTIENMGSLKSRVNSVQPIYLEGVMDAIERQIDQAALFSGMAIPVRDFKKVWGLKTNETTLNREAQKAMGSYIDRYQKNLQGDLGRGREKGDSFALLGASARGKMAMGALTGNLSVVMKQAASYPTAAGGLLGYQDLLAGLLYKGQRGKDLEEIIKKYTPLYADRDTAGIVGVNINDMNALKKKNPKLYYGLTGWIEAVDKATVRRLWYASENYVKRNFNYEVGSDKFYKEVAKVWEDTVRRTQPIYDTMNRPEYLRQNSDLAKFLLMFKTQSFQNIGILVDAVGEYKARSKDYKNNQTEANKKDKEAAFKQLVKATSSQIIQMAVFTAITAIADAMLHRPKKWADEETGLITPESFFETYFENYLGNMLGQLAFGDVIKDAVYIAAGKKYTRYDLTVAPLDAINDVISGLYNARQAVNTREYDKAWKNIIKASETASQYGLGVPVKNIENLYKGVTGNVADIAAGKNPLETTTTQQMYNRIYLAYQSGNPEIAAELSKNVDSDKIKTKMVSKLKEEDTIKEAAEYRYKSELDKYQAIVDAYVSLGFDKDWVVSAINSVMNKTYDTTGSGEYNSNDLQRAIDISAVQGSKVAQQMYDEKYSTYKADGLKNDEAKKKALSSVRSAITGKYKSQYESGTTSQKVKIRDRLCSLRVAGERLYTYDSMKSWNK